MSSYNELIALINGCINRNGVQAITGRVLNGVLRAMVNQLGAGYAMGGVAHPTDDPGTPEAPVCYYASEVGTYTHFGNIQIVPGELALLCFDLTDGWFKETMYEGFESVQATIDGNVGTPAVNVTYVNGVLSFDFSNMKGNTGAAAGFGNVTAAVDGTIGTPGVSVQTDGPDTAKNIAFQFTGLKGETGVTSVIATVDNTSGTPQCAVSLNGQQLTLAFTGLKGAQGDTGVSADYPITIVNNLTTNDPTSALSAAQGVVLAGQVSQLEHEVYVKKSVHESNVAVASLITKGYQKPDGTIGGDGTDNSWFYTPFYEVVPDSVIKLTDIIGQNTNVMTVGFYDENKAVLSDISLTTSFTTETSVNVSDSRIKYVRFSGSKQKITLGTAKIELDIYDYEPLKDVVETLQTSKFDVPVNAGAEGNILVQDENGKGKWESVNLSSFELVANKVTQLLMTATNAQYPSAKCVFDATNRVVSAHYDNFFTSSDCVLTYGYQKTDGTIGGDGTDASWRYTNFVEILQGSTLTVKKITAPANVMTIGFFDSSYNCLTDISVTGALDDTGITLTINDSRIKYVRFSGSRNTLDPDYVATYGQAVCVMDIFVSVESVKDMILSLESRMATAEGEIADLQEEIENLTPPQKIGTKYGVEHFLSYGQSLSQGDWESHIVTYTQKYNSLMFTGTPRVWEYRDSANKYAALLPAVEDVFHYQEGETPVGATVRGETPCCGAAEKYTELVIASGFDITTYQHQVLVSAPGMGGMNISDLSNKTGIYYTRLLEEVTNGKRLANEGGKTYACHSVAWIQGESDIARTYDYYYNAMKSLFENLNEDIKTITGQSEDVHFYLYQTRVYDWFGGGFHYPYIPLAQLQISLDMPNVHLAGPIYQLPLLTDWCHFSAEGSKWFGGYIGRAMKKVMLDGERWLPVHLVEHEVVGNYIFLKFYAPTLPLVFDTTNVPDRGTSKGFQIRNVDDVTQNSYLNIITAVDIVSPDTVRITCSQSPAGKKLTYAINGTADSTDKSDMGSGNLRDSSTDVFNFPIVESGADVEHKLYNWCPLFEVVLS